MNTEDHIIDCLKDKSFPPMVLIDGEWGTGKTYFVKNTLTDRLNKEFSESKTLYLSLYGISSLDDFKDKIISLHIGANQKNSSLGGLFSKIIDGISQLSGEKGVGSIIGGVSGVIKHTILSGLDDSILILDDLERVNNDGLIKNLLGEAFNLAENNKNIKVLVVANASKLFCKEDVEKVFFDMISFVSSPDFVIEIVLDEFSDVLDTKLINHLKEIIVSLGLTNIRILKRALHKFKKIYLDVKDDERIALDLASKILLEQVIRFCCCSFEPGITEDMLLNSGEYRFQKVLKLNAEYENENENKLRDKVDNILGYNFPNEISEKLVSYCFSGVYDFDDIVVDLLLPTKHATLEIMLSDWTYSLSDEEFKNGAQLLLNYINTSDGLDFVKWFQCCGRYLDLLDKRAIKYDEKLRKEILNRCNSILMNSFEELDPSKVDVLDYDRIKNLDIKEVYSDKKEEFKNYLAQENLSSLKDDFRLSWQSVAGIIYRRWQGTSLFNLIGAEFIFDSLNHWEIYNLALFISAMSYRYEMQNLEDFYLDEISTIDELITLIDDYVGNEMFGRRAALLIQIREAFENILQRMRKNMCDD